MTLHIRPASADEIEIMVDLIAQARAWQDSVGEPVAFGTDRRPEVMASVQRGEAFVGIGESGYVAAFSLETSDPLLWPDDLGEARYLHRLVVRPDSHGRGNGRQCVAFAERLAREAGAEYLRLDAVRDNTTLCAWYERQGYEPAGYVKLPHWRRGSTLYQKQLGRAVDIPRPA